MGRTSEFGSEDDGSTPSSSASGTTILGEIKYCIFCLESVCVSKCFQNLVEFQEILRANRFNKDKTRLLEFKPQTLTEFTVSNTQTEQFYKGTPSIVHIKHIESQKVVEVLYRSLCSYDTEESNFLINRAVLRINGHIVSNKEFSPINKTSSFSLTIEWTIKFNYGSIYSFNVVEEIEKTYDIEVPK